MAIDYFVQDDNGTVYYLGEDVDEYADGKIISHDGTWALGRDTVVPGVLFPAQPTVGLKFMSEDVSDEISEFDEVISLTETVVVPAGTYKNCVKIKESLGTAPSTSITPPAWAWCARFRPQVTNC